MNENYHDYIIIGAGPSGLQLGYFFEKKSLDYLIIERNNDSGSFFKKFPRDRQLISINKVYTGYSDDQKNLRWDWNSLLSDSPELLFKEYSKAYFPDADDLVKYLNDYAEHYKLKISYNTSVVGVSISSSHEFEIMCTNTTYRCKNLIIASGIPKQILPDIPGIELCELYSNCSSNPDEYINQKVLIVGKGNSGFETANNLVGTASVIHIISPENLKFAWKTHYVGNLRAVNNNYLDTYLLKSQNAVLNGEIQRIVKDNDGKYLVKINYTKVKDEELEEIKYDRIIISCGFKMDDTIFSDNFRPNTLFNGKFPALTAEWESVNIPNLYFAGVLSHSRDFKKTTSGFIHGYRYNCKVLVDILNKKNNDVDFHSQMLSGINAEQATNLVIEKINTSSALWQQNGFLGDVLIVDLQSNTMKYIEALPCDYINETLCYANDNYFIVTLEYGSNERDPFSQDVQRINRFDSDGARDSDFLHPIIRNYSKGKLISELHLIEDLDGEFNRKEHIEPLLNFFLKELKEITSVH
ncbi:NAD(P)-binding domain-containing protein [Sinomicrobium oceani]|uniref:NAD(P)-binding domain-containing protein n=1 Tax=Sinomicrobium oceani TaxID=1150368 RepID=UPI00227C41BC|nr:NAD(P)-binding domain-containing protein [Sinomicrobium oceani]